MNNLFLLKVNNVNHTNENSLNYKKNSPYGENREKEKEREKEANGEIDHSPKNLYQVCNDVLFVWFLKYPPMLPIPFLVCSLIATKGIQSTV